MRRGNIVPLMIKEEQRKLDKDILPAIGDVFCDLGSGGVWKSA